MHNVSLDTDQLEASGRRAGGQAGGKPCKVVNWVRTVMYWPNEVVELPNCVGAGVLIWKRQAWKMQGYSCGRGEKANECASLYVCTCAGAQVVWASGGVGSSPGEGLVSEAVVYVGRCHCRY